MSDRAARRRPTPAVPAPGTPGRDSPGRGTPGSGTPAHGGPGRSTPGPVGPGVPGDSAGRGGLLTVVRGARTAAAAALPGQRDERGAGGPPPRPYP